MLTLLDALQEGRLIELPDNDKKDSLQLLSHILEAVPSIPNNTDVAGSVLKREENINTALGKGFAVPHARVSFEGEMVCAVGWSPAGIDYGAPDNLPIHIVIMFFVPTNQRNQYLKEISLIAKALQELHDVSILHSFADLNSVRNYLLDMISAAKDVVGPDARARMIRLELREAEQVMEVAPVSNVLVEPVSFVLTQTGPITILTQNKQLFDLLEINRQHFQKLEQLGYFDVNGWRIVRNQSKVFYNEIALLDCIAVKILS